MANVEQDITQLLRHAAGGDRVADDQLYASVYRELMQLARGHVARAGTISLDAPVILHESYLRFGKRASEGSFVNRKTFFAYASTVMRTVIVDYVREKKALKRGSGEEHVTLNTGIAESVAGIDAVEDLDLALAELQRVDMQAYRVVEMRYFGGLSEEEVADVLEVSVPTVSRAWRRARALLFQSLRGQ